MSAPLRQLTNHEHEVVRSLYLAKSEYRDTHGYVTTTEPLEMEEWNGKHPVEENTTRHTIPVGSTLKIVMVSRFGDCGLTDKLDAVNGYGLRLQWNSPKITDIRKSRERTIP